LRGKREHSNANDSTMGPPYMTDQSPHSTPSHPRPKHFYRPDVDGLRALAVLPVILFHAGFSCPGGFIGVDVFFVISGYLITQIIERELKARRFSVFVFYQRRIRRIFPALFVMLGASTLVGYLYLPPLELKSFGASLVASSAFSSNILFYQLSGYFAPNSEYTPLLHTWTLSLEEQFYVCWPLILALLSIPVISKWEVATVLVVLVGSFLLSAHWVGGSPNMAFYLLPSRAWELALGALLSFPQISKVLVRLPRVLASVASVAGLALLGIAVAAYSRGTPFPGFAALLPCVGAALVIASGEGGTSIGGRFLSARVWVWTGKISYSLYLWHWPILLFGHLLANRKLDVFERSGLIVLVFIVAWLSWRFVESPFRDAQLIRFKTRSWVIGGLATSAVFVAIGGFLFLRDGLPTRGPLVANFGKEVKLFQESPCLARGAALPRAEDCLLGATSPSSHYQAILWGDSHAAHLAPAFGEIGKRLSLTTREITKAGCAPIPGVGFLPVDEMRAECPAFNDAALSAVLTAKQVRVVVLAAWWDAFASGSLLLTRDGQRLSIGDSRRLFVSSLRKLLTDLVDDGRQVILVGQVPLPPPELVVCVTRARFRGLDEDKCANDQSEERAQTEHLVNQLLQEVVLGLESSVQILYPHDYLCGSRRCIVQTGGQLLYMNESHLSPDGARFLASGLENCIRSAIRAGEKL
jgi:peptidoglycan/LPS O-acetylase OafA/YrhL